MSDVSESIQWTPLVFNSADWDLAQTQPFWHSFHYDWEADRQIKARLTERGNVWEIGLWPDAEMEKVARQCAEIFEEQFGLPNSSLVPDDSVMVLQTWGDGLDACEAVVALEDAFGCVIDGEKLGKIRENGDEQQNQITKPSDSFWFRQPQLRRRMFHGFRAARFQNCRNHILEENIAILSNFPELLSVNHATKSILKCFDRFACIQPIAPRLQNHDRIIGNKRRIGQSKLFFENLRTLPRNLLGLCIRPQPDSPDITTFRQQFLDLLPRFPVIMKRVPRRLRLHQIPIRTVENKRSHGNLITATHKLFVL